MKKNSGLWKTVIQNLTTHQVETQKKAIEGTPTNTDLKILIRTLEFFFAPAKSQMSTTEHFRGEGITQKFIAQMLRPNEATVIK